MNLKSPKVRIVRKPWASVGHPFRMLSTKMIDQALSPQTGEPLLGSSDGDRTNALNFVFFAEMWLECAAGMFSVQVLGGLFVCASICSRVATVSCCALSGYSNQWLLSPQTTTVKTDVGIQSVPVATSMIFDVLGFSLCRAERRSRNANILSRPAFDSFHELLIAHCTRSSRGRMMKFASLTHVSAR